MSDITVRPSIATMSDEAIALARGMADAMRAMPEAIIPIKITDDLHAGMYARTCEVPAGATVAGVLLKVPMLFILSGNALLYVGTDAPLHLAGYHVLKANAGRMQVLHALEETHVTAIFATDAETVEEAEREATDETGLLASRQLLEGA